MIVARKVGVNNPTMRKLNVWSAVLLHIAY